MSRSVPGFPRDRRSATVVPMTLTRTDALEFRAIVRSVTGDAGVTEVMLEAGAKENPPGGSKKGIGAKGKAGAAHPKTKAKGGEGEGEG
jgi:hypothetical protein